MTFISKLTKKVSGTSRLNLLVLLIVIASSVIVLMFHHGSSTLSGNTTPNTLSANGTSHLQPNSNKAISRTSSAGGSQTGMTAGQNSSTKAPNKTNNSSSAGKSVAGGTSNGQNTSSSSSNNTGTQTQNQPPSATGPLSTITVSSFSANASPSTTTRCNISQSVTFSTNGSGDVSVIWQVYSSHTSSAYYDPFVHSFSAAGAQTDSSNSSWQGLEPGDSYRVMATLISGGVIQVAGPVTIGSCAGPSSLLSPNQASFMGSPVVGNSLNVYQNADPTFKNSCSMNLQANFSVTGPGSVQAVYTITSSSSIGATLYSTDQETFSGPGSATDSSYIRMPHLPSGVYSITVKLNVLGDPAHSSTYGPVTSACS